MKIILIVILLGILTNDNSLSSPSTEIGIGEQPQLSVDASGVIRLVYGRENKILCSVSMDDGATFSTPSVIAEIIDMHLGMTRGPQLVSSRDYSLVTAMDKKGNIHAFQLDHKNKKWRKIKYVNDVDGSAPEGLMSVAADAENNFYAVWLDVREDKNNKIAFSSLKKNGTWSQNKIIYTSPDKTVCECCKPSVSVSGKKVSVMFRNWISGSRDLYVTTSLDGGQRFGVASKLGNGTWKLKGCPMDGGSVLIDKNDIIHTVWQREGVVYYDQPDQSEIRIAEGRGCHLFGSDTPFITWQQGTQIYGQPLGGSKSNIGEGSAISVVQTNEKKLLAAWEKNGKIVHRIL